MSVKFKGDIYMVADGATAHEIGIDASRLLLAVAVESLREKQPPKKELKDLLLGLLCGAVGHFAEELSIEEIQEQLDHCKRMVQEVPCFSMKPGATPSGKGVH